MIRVVTAFVCALGWAIFPWTSSADTFEISNPLQLNWPWELTYRDYAAGTFDGPQAIRFGDETRPVQIQRVESAAGPRDRAWFIATVPAESPEPLRVSIEKAEAKPGITLQRRDGLLVIDNGVYQFRVRDFQGPLENPTPLDRVAHWIAGMRVNGEATWDGRAWFEGTQMVSAIETEVVDQGPVFVDLRITYRFADAETGEDTQAMPLANGKQSHTFKPNQLPSESVPKLTAHYEVLVRFVAGDPWVDINERYHLPRSGEIKPWGVHQYWLAWGKPVDVPTPVDGVMKGNDHMPVDSVAWVRWFDYDKFGGNSDLRVVPAEPRDSQKGRPFALLRPRWNQGGGGAQDFILTSGGRGAWVQRGEVKREADPGYDPDNPAVGVIATFASKWVGPYPATIATYALDGNRGRARFPLIDGERSGQHYGQRAYAIVLGPRKLFDSTGRLNSLVRRHTDWTLVAQMNKYALTWERDERLAGPSILATRAQLQSLREDYEQKRESPAVAALRKASQELAAAEAERDDLNDTAKALQNEAKDKSRSQDDRERAAEELKEVRRQLKELNGRLASDDAKVVRLIVQNKRGNADLGPAQLWLQRRYQDDFLNPTSHPTRSLATGLIGQDLFAAGQPIGGPLHAAIGYIFTDLDHWPGWKNGWSPGNPNFHTDKYQVALFVGAAMRDHPHAKEWICFGVDNFNEDIDKVLSAPDGVGYECPGYAGYSINLQLKNARLIANTGFGDPVTSNPLFAKTATWHRKLLTPIDARLGLRHEAPIGDTHRWTAGLGGGFGKLAAFYRDSDPEFASELMGVWKYLESQGYGKKHGLRESLIEIDPSIQPTAIESMDWSSEAFEGFGAVMRDGFGMPRESFVSVKAGHARGHYHNDELSFHFYADGTPVSLDYNCSYDPRGDHAALHNSMTFGQLGTVRHNAREEKVEAQEQIGSSGRVIDFAATPIADAVIARRSSNRLSMTPIYPEDSEFSRKYPTRSVEPITHERTVALIKHDEKGPVSDYLFVRDRTVSDEPQQVNIHLLARNAKVDGNTVLLEGQWDKDFVVYFVDAPGLDIDVRQWHYFDEWLASPGEQYVPRPGETSEQWDQRMQRLMEAHSVKKLPLPGWEPKHQTPKLSEDWHRLIKETDGKALTPPRHWNDVWRYGEYQVWLRCSTDPGATVSWVLYAYPRGTEPPSFERLDEGKAVRVTVGDVSDVIRFEEGLAIERDGQSHPILKPRESADTTN